MSLARSASPREKANRDGRRILVAGGTFVRAKIEVCRQLFPSLVSWDGSEWVIVDNIGLRAVVKNPKWWMEVPEPPGGP